MDFRLDSDQELIRQTAKEFAEREVEPLAAEIDRTHAFSWDLFRRTPRTRLPWRVPASLRLPRGNPLLGFRVQFPQWEFYGCEPITYSPRSHCLSAG
ncbi:MAG: acyl-CoA dehydrogenase family protein [Desulfovibrio sp.]|nr:acyl-CoA dehydrogenase family protein [Desulfovibrio sp.]